MDQKESVVRGQTSQDGITIGQLQPPLSLYLFIRFRNYRPTGAPAKYMREAMTKRCSSTLFFLKKTAYTFTKIK